MKGHRLLTVGGNSRVESDFKFILVTLKGVVNEYQSAGKEAAEVTKYLGKAWWMNEGLKCH